MSAESDFFNVNARPVRNIHLKYGGSNNLQNSKEKNFVEISLKDMHQEEVQSR